MEFSRESHFMALTCLCRKLFSCTNKVFTVVQTVGRAGYFSISKRVICG